METNTSFDMRDAIKAAMPKIEWQSRWLRKVDAASYAWRNNHNRGNRRRAALWDRRMQYCAARAVGLPHREALKPL